MKPLLPYHQSPHTAKRLLWLMEYTFKKLAKDYGLEVNAIRFVINEYLPGKTLTPNQRQAAIVLGIQKSA